MVSHIAAAFGIRHRPAAALVNSKQSNKTLQATPDGAVSSADADGAFWLGVPELGR